MPHPKGVPNPNAGRKPGVPNKATSEAREAIAKFIDGNVDRLNGWLDAIADDSPKDAFNCFMDVVEYHIPKLARQEHTGKDGEDLPTPVIIGSALDTLPDSVRSKLREALKDASEKD